MTKNAWANKTIPPLIIILVIACVWYALESRPTAELVPSAASASSNSDNDSTNSGVASASVVPAIDTTVQKIGTNVHFSVPSVPLKNIQKVEFYVEGQFVGTAYDKPYSVVVSENTLTAGSHTVTAKIYTDSTTAQSKPASFTAAPTKPVEQPIDTTDPDGATVGGGATTPPPAPTLPAIERPYEVSATIGSDSTSVTITWTAPSGATQYEVWRDGVNIATTTGTGFTDTGLAAGHTYDYQIIAVGAGGQKSDPSSMAAATMPPTPDDGSSGVAPPDKSTPKDDTAAANT